MVQNQILGEGQSAFAPNFEFRNCGIRGTSGTVNGISCAVTDPNGVGVIDGCYLTGAGGSSDQGIWVDPFRHAGTLRITNSLIEEWGAVALYAETGSPRGEGGRIELDNCYFRNNDGGDVRINNGSVNNVTVYHTDIPASGPGDATPGIAFRNWYDTTTGVVDVTNCNIDVSEVNGEIIQIRANNPAQWTFTDCQMVGRRDDGGRAQFVNVGTDPDVSVQPGIPQSLTEAAEGTAGGGGVDPSDVITDGQNTLSLRPR